MNFLRSFASKMTVGAVAVMLALAGCDKSPTTTTTPTTNSSAKPLKMAFVTNNASDFWNIAAAGIHAYEKETGVKVDIKIPTNGKIEEQNQILEALTSQGYQAIAVSAISGKDQVENINTAAKSAKVLCFDSDSAKSNRICYIGTNNFQAGQTLGKEIVKLLPDGGKMAIFVGTLAADNASQRLAGIEDAIKGHKIEIVVKKEDNTDRVAARSNVENVINAYADIKLLCGLWSYNGPAIAAAIEASGKKGKILAAVFDEETDTLNYIGSGIISCTVVQKPYEFGKQSAKMMHEVLTKGDSVVPASKIVDTGVQVIDAKNVADFKAELAKLKSGK